MTVTDTYYMIAGHKYDRVSAVLSYGSTDYANVPERTMEDARRRGQQIHSYIDYINKGLAVDVPEHLLEHVQNYEEWKRDNVRRVIGSELPVYSTIYKYAGRSDLVAELTTGKLALVDIKTTAARMRCHCAQVVAYTMALREMGYKIEQVIILYIDKNTGVCTPVKLRDFRTHQNGWTCMLGNYRYNKA